MLMNNLKTFYSFLGKIRVNCFQFPLEILSILDMLFWKKANIAPNIKVELKQTPHKNELICAIPLSVNT